jgi:membrane protease YdiL (CAAX protease family)
MAIVRSGSTTSILELFGPITLFVSVYVAIFLTAGYGGAAIGLPYPQWAALIAAIAATAFTIRVAEGGRWRLGVFVKPRLAAIDFLLGVAFASALVLVADALIIATTSLRQVRGNGLPGFELVAVFIPAAIHEELVFRGYLFQKMRVWSRGAAIGITSSLFAILHAGNRGITALATINLFLAGVLLAFAYERFGRLWFPIGIHLAWNLLSGPILGFGVSGYLARASLLRTVGSGPAWITGGTFGIEGSVWMALVEAGGIFLVSRRLQREQ